MTFRAAFDLLLDHVGDLPWIVAFDVPALRDVASADLLAGAFHLDDSAALEGCTAIAMSPHGPCLIRNGTMTWVNAPPQAPSQVTLRERYGSWLTLLDVRDPISIGLGHADGFDPVVLVVDQPIDGRATARAVLDREPDISGYELLTACGVRTAGLSRHGDRWIAGFENLLASHLLNGLLAGFGRTFACNRFFLIGAQIDPALETGLIQAGASRVAGARRETLETALRLAQAARKRNLQMLCRGPEPDPGEAMGDLVPLGLMLHALREAAP
jgi:hypothetical protein